LTTSPRTRKRRDGFFSDREAKKGGERGKDEKKGRHRISIPLASKKQLNGKGPWR